ncbi:MAG: L-2-amino-thiazoline-4-carboxylic acid hydrolase [Deltaproteobacteria bacterium]|jgi:hypothetical protein|nr:L-2-amino-thiazoline-4-carboxylic acid hydrolase [Deltaproteobacteria bacterium]MBW2533029.1 L-2-amino-thiazoline-4-carboxylic acid hydrolase [Deltaproteobacteria bacterium]
MSDYYVAKRRQLLRKHDRMFRRVRRILTDREGAAFADQVVADTRSELERMLPGLPYVGGRRNPWTSIIVVNGSFIALYRAMRRQGKGERDTVAVGCELADGLFRPVPSWLLRSGGGLLVAALPHVLGRAAARSQERRYPEDWVFRIEGRSDEYDLALVMEECAVIKLYDALDVPELKPYCSFFDVTYSRHMNLGLDASQTLGLGCSTCRLLYKRGRPTAIPPALDGLMP